MAGSSRYQEVKVPAHFVATVRKQRARAACPDAGLPAVLCGLETVVRCSVLCGLETIVQGMLLLTSKISLHTSVNRIKIIHRRGSSLLSWRFQTLLN